jgi:hypothetical protein
MATYGEIRTKFLARLNRRDCTSALADGFLADAIKRIQRVLRTPANEESLQVTISAATYLTLGRLPIPDDYLRLKDLTLTNSAGKTVVLRRKPLEEVLREIDFGVQGTSTIFARQGGSWLVAPRPLTNDVIRIDYWSEYTAVSADTDDTLILDIADDLIIFGALSYACDHYYDKRGPLFEQRFTQILSDIQAQGDDDELGADACVAQAFDYPSDE